MDEVVVLTAFFEELEKIAIAKRLRPISGSLGYGEGSGNLIFTELKRKGKELMKGRTRTVRSKKVTPGVDGGPTKTKKVLEYAPAEGLSSADLAKYYTGRALRSVGKGGEKVERFARENPGTAAALGLGAVGTGVAAASLLKDD